MTTKLSKADKEMGERMKFLRELLRDFDLRLHGYEPGVSAIMGHKPFPTMLDFGYSEWKWLEPLLIELRELRKHEGG